MLKNGSNNANEQLHSAGTSYINGGNLAVGTTSASARLQVNGSTSDTTATALVIRNSSGNSLFSVRNDGRVDMPQGAVNITNDLTVSGNLTVNGTTTTLNTATLDVEDKNITLNYSTGNSNASADGAGITCLLYTSPSPRDRQKSRMPSSA